MSTQFTVSQSVQSMIDCNCPMVFYYNHSRPEVKRIVHPILIVGKHVICVESDTGKHKRFKLDGIQFPEEKNECEGCINELANQQGHMNGCLSEERMTKEPKIIGKRHFWDCGYGWNVNTDSCECGERGPAHCWFDNGHREVLNNM